MPPRVLLPVAVGSLSLWVANPGVLSQPPTSLVGFGVAALWYGPPLHGGKRPLTHSPRREVVSGPATLRVPTPRFLGSSLVAVGSRSLSVASSGSESSPSTLDRKSLAAWVQLTIGPHADDLFEG